MNTAIARCKSKYIRWFSAAVMLATTSAVVLAGPDNADASEGKAAGSDCAPDNWRALDTNDDGYAKEDEVASVAPCIDFGAVDTSGDGKLSRVEFLDFKAGKASDDSATASADSKADTRKHSSEQTNDSDCLPDSFTKLDLNGDGYAKRAEVQEAAGCVDFAAADTNGDGNFSRVEFMTYGENQSQQASNAGESNGGGQKQSKTASSSSQQTGAKNSGGNVDQEQYHTPMALVSNVPKGKLHNPFDPNDKEVVKQGHKLFNNRGCGGCHGGGGGGGMGPALTDSIWSYGDEPDTLYRLVTLGSKKLRSEYGYTRNMMQTIKGAMPGLGASFKDDPKDIWRIITWVESMHRGSQ